MDAVKRPILKDGGHGRYRCPGIRIRISRHIRPPRA